LPSAAPELSGAVGSCLDADGADFTDDEGEENSVLRNPARTFTPEQDHGHLSPAPLPFESGEGEIRGAIRCDPVRSSAIRCDPVRERTCDPGTKPNQAE